LSLASSSTPAKLSEGTFTGAARGAAKAERLSRPLERKDMLRGGMRRGPEATWRAQLRSPVCYRGAALHLARIRAHGPETSGRGVLVDSSSLLSHRAHVKFRPCHSFTRSHTLASRSSCEDDVCCHLSALQRCRKPGLLRRAACWAGRQYIHRRVHPSLAPSRIYA
jgi:hypothetical protein